MASKNKKRPVQQQKQVQLPSTGEGADSAMDVLRRQRTQRPADAPPAPPAKK